MDPVKLMGIKDWPVPHNVKGVRSFLGFGNFYRRFIDHFSEIAKPLNDLTKKGLKWEWTPECQKAFRELQKKFLEGPTLQMPDTQKPFAIESDTSKWATGAVLCQQDINGDWHPCGYISNGFSPTERNYEIYDRELLGIIRALETWRHYFIGSPFPVTILSDHKNLTYFRMAQKLNRRQARWSLFPSEYDIELIHIPGSRMVQSDALSRREDHIPKEDNDNEDRIMLPSKLFINMIDMELHTQILESVMKDEIVQDALMAIKEHGPLPMKSSLQDWVIEEDGIILFQDHCYVPKDEQLRRNIVEKYHMAPSAGHPGRFQTLELMRRDYWWPGMNTFIQKYVTGCTTCQQMKVNTHPTKPGLLPIPAEKHAQPFSMITMDFITGLPESKGYDAILVIVDHNLTKGVILHPCTKETDTIKTANILYERVYSKFGLPDINNSDRGPQFVSKAFQALTKLLKIKAKLSTAYHPQTDGQTEQLNQELETYL